MKGTAEFSTSLHFVAERLASFAGASRVCGMEQSVPKIRRARSALPAIAPAPDGSR